MRSTQRSTLVGALILGLGVVALSHCALDSEGTATLLEPTGGGGAGLGGGGGSNMVQPPAGGAGQGSGGGAGQGGAGGAGAGGAGPGGSAGASGEGGGGAGGASLPNVLGCTPWLPDSNQWRFGGDARFDPTKGIVLTPPDQSEHWGQAYLQLSPDDDVVINELEVAFTFAFEASPAEGDFAEGAAVWLLRRNDAVDPRSLARTTSFGVPDAPFGAALAFDLAPTAQAFAGLYGCGSADFDTLTDDIVADNPRERLAIAASPSRLGRHTARFRLTRTNVDELDDDMTLTGTLVSMAGASFSADLEDGADDLFDAVGRLGFSAGSGAGGAVHTLLGVEIKVNDTTCLEPP